MPYPITDSNWSVQVDNKPTFFGVLWKYFDEIAKENRWGPNTQVLYAGQYEKRVLPRLSSLPLECYTAEDFKRVIAEISCEEKINAPSTVEHYRNLIKCVIEEAVREEKMKDPLWGTPFSSVTTPKQVQEQEKKKLPKSISVAQHCALTVGVYKKAPASGEGKGLLLCYETGVRPKESAGSSIGDFKEPQLGGDFSCIAIHSSTIGQGHQRRDKTKTPNGYRMCILGPVGTELLRDKVETIRGMIESGDLQLPPGSPMEAIPIANIPADWLTPCSSQQLSQAFRTLLRDINYKSEEYLAACKVVESEEFQEAVRRITPKELGFAEEKDPSAYILRRLFCTELHIVGCSRPQRQNLMGHVIEDPAVERRDFRNEDQLATLVQLLNKRPGTNRKVLEKTVVTMDSQVYQNEDFHSETIRIPAQKGKLVIRISSHESLTSVNASFTFPEGFRGVCEYRQQRTLASQRQDANVLNDYYDAFRKAYAEMENREMNEEIVSRHSISLPSQENTI